MELSLEPKLKLALHRFFYAWLAAALTWPTFFVNFTKPDWEKPLIVTAILLFIPGIIAALLPFTKKLYYIPLSWVIGLVIALLYITRFGMDIFVPIK